jgi:oxygen-dependent protoporphyrinogen oxidase
VSELEKVTVVGGGVAGLIAARRIALRGHPVDLIEATDRLGGTIAHRRVGGIDLDVGAESFAVRGGHVAALATELGLGEDIVSPAAAGAWLQRAAGGPVPLPATGILGIPGTPLAADVIAAIGTGAALRAQLDAIIPSVWTRRSETLGHLVRRRMGRGVLERLVDPVVRGVQSTPADEYPIDRVPGLRAAIAREGSLAAAVRSLRDSAPPGSAVAGIRGGMNRLITELVADLESLEVGFEFGRRVGSLDELDGAVVLATSLTPGGTSIVVATLVVDAPELDAAPRGSGVIVAKGAPGIRARALTHSTAKWEWLRERADGRHVLRLSYEHDAADLETVSLADAAALLGVEIAGLVDFDRTVWTRSAPASAPSGVVVVGETIAGTGLASVVRQAEDAASALIDSLDQARP